MATSLKKNHNESKRDVTYSDDASFRSGEDSLSVSSEWAKPTTPTETRSLKDIKSEKLSPYYLPIDKSLFHDTIISIVSESEPSDAETLLSTSSDDCWDDVEEEPEAERICEDEAGNTDIKLEPASEDEQLPSSRGDVASTSASNATDRGISPPLSGNEERVGDEEICELFETPGRRHNTTYIVEEYKRWQASKYMFATSSESVYLSDSPDDERTKIVAKNSTPCRCTDSFESETQSSCSIQDVPGKPLNVSRQLGEGLDATHLTLVSSEATLPVGSPSSSTRVAESRQITQPTPRRTVKDLLTFFSLVPPGAATSNTDGRHNLRSKQPNSRSGSELRVNHPDAPTQCERFSSQKPANLSPNLKAMPPTQRVPCSVKETQSASRGTSQKNSRAPTPCKRHQKETPQASVINSVRSRAPDTLHFKSTDYAVRCDDVTLGRMEASNTEAMSRCSLVNGAARQNGRGTTSFAVEPDAKLKHQSPSTRSSNGHLHKTLSLVTQVDGLVTPSIRQLTDIAPSTPTVAGGKTRSPRQSGSWRQTASVPAKPVQTAKRHSVVKSLDASLADDECSDFDATPHSSPSVPARLLYQRYSAKKTVNPFVQPRVVERKETLERNVDGRCVIGSISVSVDNHRSRKYSQYTPKINQTMGWKDNVWQHGNRRSPNAASTIQRNRRSPDAASTIQRNRRPPDAASTIQRNRRSPDPASTIQCIRRSPDAASTMQRNVGSPKASCPPSRVISSRSSCVLPDKTTVLTNGKTSPNPGTSKPDRVSTFDDNNNRKSSTLPACRPRSEQETQLPCAEDKKGTQTDAGEGVSATCLQTIQRERAKHFHENCATDEASSNMKARNVLTPNGTPTKLTPTSRRNLNSKTCSTPVPLDHLSRVNENTPHQSSPAARSKFVVTRHSGSPSVIFAKLKLQSPSTRSSNEHMDKDSTFAIPLPTEDTRPNGLIRTVRQMGVHSSDLPTSVATAAPGRRVAEPARHCKQSLQSKKEHDVVSLKTVDRPRAVSKQNDPATWKHDMLLLDKSKPGVSRQRDTVFVGKGPARHGRYVGSPSRCQSSGKHDGRTWAEESRSRKRLGFRNPNDNSDRQSSNQPRVIRTTDDDLHERTTVDAHVRPRDATAPDKERLLKQSSEKLTRVDSVVSQRKTRRVPLFRTSSPIEDSAVVESESDALMNISCLSSIHCTAKDTVSSCGANRPVIRQHPVNPISSDSDRMSAASRASMVIVLDSDNSGGGHEDTFCTLVDSPLAKQRQPSKHGGPSVVRRDSGFDVYEFSEGGDVDSPVNSLRAKTAVSCHGSRKKSTAGQLTHQNHVPEKSDDNQQKELTPLRRHAIEADTLRRTVSRSCHVVTSNVTDGRYMERGDSGRASVRLKRTRCDDMIRSYNSPAKRANVSLPLGHTNSPRHPHVKITKQSSVCQQRNVEMHVSSCLGPGRCKKPFCFACVAVGN